MKSSFSKILFSFFLFFIYSTLFATTQEIACETDSDCGQARKCYKNVCMKKKELFSSYSVVDVTLGDKDPSMFGGLIIPNPAKKLVLGQFKIKAGDSKGKLFSFDAISLKIKKGSTDIYFSNIKLVYDKNKNGKFDSSEDIIATQDDVETNTIKLETEITKSAYPTGEEENFLIVGDVEFKKETVPPTALFGIIVPNKESVVVSNGGTIDKTPVNLSFATFNFEPTSGYFIVEKMKTIKAPTSWKEINKSQKMLFFRVKAIDIDNAINSLSVKIPDGFVAFGEEFAEISIYLSDKNMSEVKLLAKKTFSNENQKAVVFSSLASSLSLKKGEEKYLLIKGTPFMYAGSHSKIYINKNCFTLSTTESFLGLPIESDNFEYNCKESDEGCRIKDDGSKSSDGGCSLILF